MDSQETNDLSRKFNEIRCQLGVSLASVMDEIITSLHTINKKLENIENNKPDDEILSEEIIVNKPLPIPLKAAPMKSSFKMVKDADPELHRSVKNLRNMVSAAQVTDNKNDYLKFMPKNTEEVKLIKCFRELCNMYSNTMTTHEITKDFINALCDSFITVQKKYEALANKKKKKLK